MKKLKSKVMLLGSKKRGWTINMSDNQGYEEDLSITHEEAVVLLGLLKKKLIMKGLETKV